MDTKFESILDMPASDIERPKPLPVGTYVAMVEGMPRIDKSTKKQTEYVEFTMKILGAQEDVDPDALEEYGGIGEATVKNTYYITDKSTYRLKEFYIALGLDIEGKTSRELLEECPGKECLITIKHQPAQSGDMVFANITDVAPVN